MHEYQYLEVDLPMDTDLIHIQALSLHQIIAAVLQIASEKEIRTDVSRVGQKHISLVLDAMKSCIHDIHGSEKQRCGNTQWNCSWERDGAGRKQKLNHLCDTSQNDHEEDCMPAFVFHGRNHWMDHRAP